MKTLTDAEYANLTERIQNLRAQLATVTKERDEAAEIANENYDTILALRRQVKELEAWNGSRPAKLR